MKIMTATKRQALVHAMAEVLVLVEMETYFEESGTEDDIINLRNKGIYQEDGDSFVVRPEYQQKWHNAVETVDVIINSTFNGNMIPINLAL